MHTALGLRLTSLALMCCVLCCAVLWCAVLCCAVLCCALFTQLQCLQAKKKATQLQEEQEKLLETNIELQERQQRFMLQQLHQVEEQKAAKAQLQSQQAKALHDLAVREDALSECHRQLQEAKALLQVRSHCTMGHVCQEACGVLLNKLCAKCRSGTALPLDMQQLCL
jgi:septal ring factor EnvC (AmiA/AmiB activator)